MRNIYSQEGEGSFCSAVASPLEATRIVHISDPSSLTQLDERRKLPPSSAEALEKKQRSQLVINHGREQILRLF